MFFFFWEVLVEFEFVLLMSVFLEFLNCFVFFRFFFKIFEFVLKVKLCIWVVNFFLGLDVLLNFMEDGVRFLVYKVILELLLFLFNLLKKSGF